MIITISGTAGSGKSTVASEIAKELNLEYHSTGNLMRDMAKEKGMTLLELSKKAEENKSIDKELDEKQIKLGKEKDNFVIEGRLSAHFIPHADFKIFLDADTEIRAKRIMEHKRHDEKSEDMNEMLMIMDTREKSEKQRYKKYYDVDYMDKNQYDFCIDTSKKNANEIVREILSIVRK